LIDMVFFPDPPYGKPGHSSCWHE